MKRKWIATALMFYILCVPAFAHSGRTDSAGGHTNHSTGEYHYHHGYSEHQHYDMNGDGIKDCPYKFKDATNKSTSTTKNSNTNVSSIQSKKDNDDVFTVLSLGSAVIALYIYFRRN